MNVRNDSGIRFEGDALDDYAFTVRTTRRKGANQEVVAEIFQRPG
jgi:hypothetical protein